MFIQKLRRTKSRLFFRICLLLLFTLAFSGLLILPSPTTYAQSPSEPQKIIVAPAGTVTWAELQQGDSVSGQATSTPRVIPYLTAPAPQAIGVEGDSLSSATLPPPPTGPIQALAGSTLATNFAALGDNNTSIPPDTMGAAGPAHLVTMLNTQVRIQDKSGGNLSTASLSNFWTNGTGVTGSPFDPRLIFDTLSGRWLATIDLDGQSANSSIGFAISATDDPTGSWTFYEIDSDPTNTDWADFPDIGTNSKWVAITNNMFAVSNNASKGVKMWVIDKSTALAGGALTINVFDTGFDNGAGFTLRTAQTFDPAEPALYLADNFYAAGGGLGAPLMRMSQITGTAASPTWQVVDGSTITPNSGLFALDNSFEFQQIDADQLGTATDVETNDPRLQNAVFRHGRLWTTHSGGLPFDGNQTTANANRTAVFWYELDPAAMASSGDPIVQSGVIDGGSGVHHFFPSLAVNTNDEMAIGFSRSDSTKFVEAVMTGRQANDPAGTVDPIIVIKAGEDSYIKDFGFGRVRWGDYSGTSVDPADDLSFWAVQEYAETDVGAGQVNDRWGTWWGQLVFQVDLALSKTTAITEVDPGQELAYTLVVTNIGPADASGVVVDDPLPPAVTFISAQASQGSYSSGSGAWQVGSLNNTSTAMLTLTVRPNFDAISQTITNTAVISAVDQLETVLDNNQASAVFKTSSNRFIYLPSVLKN